MDKELLPGMFNPGQEIREETKMEPRANGVGVDSGG